MTTVIGCFLIELSIILTIFLITDAFIIWFQALFKKKKKIRFKILYFETPYFNVTEILVKFRITSWKRKPINYSSFSYNYKFKAFRKLVLFAGFKRSC